MGIYHNIHDNHNINDDHYYYCTLYDCACDKPLDYYDTSNNLHTTTRTDNARAASSGSSTTNRAASHPRDTSPATTRD
jgi:hypothetical protein